MTDLELAVQAACGAAALLIERGRRPARGLGAKSSATDMVSDADREAERLISDQLRAERPDDGLLGEEGATAAAASGRRWVVDPLDGYYERGVKRWDCAAGILLVREAGGEVTALAGEPAGIAAACPELVGPLAELVGGASGGADLAER